MVRLNIPSIFIYGGSILPGTFRGAPVTVQDLFEAVGKHASGEYSDEELATVEACDQRRCRWSAAAFQRSIYDDFQRPTPARAGAKNRRGANERSSGDTGGNDDALLCTGCPFRPSEQRRDIKPRAGGREDCLNGTFRHARHRHCDAGDHQEIALLSEAWITLAATTW
jgi:hypothetical protein